MLGFVPPPFAAAGAGPPPRAVEGDVPCRKCRYNVRGLSTDGRCPECGTPVGLSVRGDLLRYSDPAWVDRLARGATVIQWYVVAVIGQIIACVLLASRSWVAGRDARVMVEVAGLAAHALFIVGVWLLTSPDPSGLGEDRYGTSRKLIRVALLIGVARQLAGVAIVTGRPSPEVRLVLTVAGGGAGVASLVGLFATLAYLGRLAARIPDADVAARCRSLVWGFGVPLAVLVGSGLLAALTTAGGGPAAGCFACPALLAVVPLLVYGFLFLRLLSTLAKRFAVQATQARITWASVDAARPAPTEPTRP